MEVHVSIMLSLHVPIHCTQEVRGSTYKYNATVVCSCSLYSGSTWKYM